MSKILVIQIKTSNNIINFQIKTIQTSIKQTIHHHHILILKTNPLNNQINSGINNIRLTQTLPLNYCNQQIIIRNSNMEIISKINNNNNNNNKDLINSHNNNNLVNLANNNHLINNNKIPLVRPHNNFLVANNSHLMDNNSHNHLINN